jgi:hypothetical protein
MLFNYARRRFHAQAGYRIEALNEVALTRMAVSSAPSFYWPGVKKVLPPAKF